MNYAACDWADIAAGETSVPASLLAEDCLELGAQLASATARAEAAEAHIAELERRLAMATDFKLPNGDRVYYYNAGFGRKPWRWDARHDEYATRYATQQEALDAALAAAKEKPDAE